MNDTKFRHELKYPVTAAQIALLKNRIRGLIPPDPHAGPAGSYRIRSLYFDDAYNTCFYENENGTDPREKFRIRIYNASAVRIRLECKRKERGKTHKRSCPLTEEQTRALMGGKPLPDIASQHPLLQKLTAQMLTRGLKPVVIVEYDRIPFIYKNGNVRITFDTNICSGTAVETFLDPAIPRRPILGVGQELLEVKYDEYLPDFIYQTLQLHSLRQSAFSKYYLCRKFSR